MSRMIRSQLRQRLFDPVFMYQGYQMIRYLVSLIVSVIWVKSALPSEDLGYLEMMIFVVVSLSVFWSAGLNNAVFSLYHTLSPEKKRALPCNYIWVMVILSAVLALIVYFFSDGVLYIFTGLTDIPGWSLMPLYIFFSVPLTTIEGLLFLRKKTRELMWYTIWSQGGLLVILFFVAVWQPDISAIITALIVWAMVKWSYMWFISGDGPWTKPDRKLMLFIMIYSWPLILALAAGYGMDMIDGLFVSHYYETSYFPVFKYGAREMPLSALLLSSLSAAMIPELMNSSLKGLDLAQRTTRLMHILYPVSFVLMCISPWIFPLIYSEAYQDSAYIFNIYLLILSSRILLPQTYTMALQKHKVILWSGVMELILNVGLSFLLMRYWGVYGLAIATVLAYFFQKMYLMMYNKYYLRIPLSGYLNWRYYTMYNILLVCFFILSFYIKP